MTDGISPASARAIDGRGVGAGVVGDRDPVAVGELRGQVGVEPPDRRLEVGLLVVDGDDDVEHDAAGGGGGLRGMQVGLRDVDAHVVEGGRRCCPVVVANLCVDCASGRGFGMVAPECGEIGHEPAPVRS